MTQQYKSTKLNKAYKGFAILLLSLLCLVSLSYANDDDNLNDTFQDAVTIDFFWSNQCGHCAEEKPFLAELVQKYPIKLNSYEIHNQSNVELLTEKALEYGFEVKGVPVTFIEEKYWVGYSDSRGEDMENFIQQKLQLNQNNISNNNSNMNETTDSTIIDLPIFGKIDTGNTEMSALVFTLVVAFFDGLNPCSLWILTLLLGIVINTGSRKKTFLVGATFLTITAITYGISIFGIFNLFKIIQGHTSFSLFGMPVAFSNQMFIVTLVSVMALIFAVVNIKDYFWFQKGFSFTISDKYKPKIFRDTRNIIKNRDSVLAMIGFTIVMALGITLVELPCTIQLPLVWSTFMANNDVNSFMFFVLFLIYMLIYLLDEILFFSIAVYTLRATHFEEKHGRILKLFGGLIMLCLGLVLLLDYNIMNSITGTLQVFAFAGLVGVIILVIHRKVLPQFGIIIGSEKLDKKNKLFDDNDNKEDNVAISNNQKNKNENQQDNLQEDIPKNNKHNVENKRNQENKIKKSRIKSKSKTKTNKNKINKKKNN